MTTDTIVSKVWSFCHTLRDDGVGYRNNIHHTLKRNPLRLENLRDFIDCYRPGNRHKRKTTWDAEKNPDGRWRKYTYEELGARDKTSLDLFWLKDDSLADLDNLPEPADLAEEIIENLESGLASFRSVAAALPNTGVEDRPTQFAQAL